jgi:hypothetical protein
MLVKHEDKYYWFLYANKSGSTFLKFMIKEIEKNNEFFEIDEHNFIEKEWTRKLFLDAGYDLDNFEIIIYGRNPYMRFVSQFYHWWLNPFTHDVHDWGGKWLRDRPGNLNIIRRNDLNIEQPDDAFMEILKDLSNQEKHNFMIKYWTAWIQSQPQEIRIEKFRHFTKVFYAYMKEYGYSGPTFQQWAGKHLDWQLSDLREVNRLFPANDNWEHDRNPIGVYEGEYVGGFVERWSKNTQQIENLKENFIFKELIDIDKQKKKLEFVNTKTPFEKKQSSFSSKRKIYASHYDDETIKIVNEIYKCDFLLFNYKMVNNFADLEKNFIKNY